MRHRPRQRPLPTRATRPSLPGGGPRRSGARTRRSSTETNGRFLGGLVLPFSSLVAFGLADVAAAQVTPLGAELQVNTYTTGEQDRPDVVWRANGEIVVVWESDGSLGDDDESNSVQLRRFTSAGAAIGVELQVNGFTGGPQTSPRVRAAANGTFVVVFAGTGPGDTTYPGILARRFAASGSALGSAFLVNSYTPGSQTSPAVAERSDGGFTVVWTNPAGYGPGTDADQESVAMRRVSSAGALQGSDAQVNTYTTGKQFLPAVASDGDGGFVVVWQSNGSNDSDDDSGSVRVQRYSAAGATVGSSFQANTFTSGNQGQPSVSMSSGGEFVLAWSSNGSTGGDSSLTSIQARRFDSAGSPLGSEMQVNQFTSGFQSVADVARRDDGAFLVVWQSSSDDVDTSGWSVHGRLYSPAGTALGNEFLLSSYTTGNQERPRIAFAPNGGHFAAVWDSDGSSGTDQDAESIKLRRFVLDSDGDGVDDGQDVCPGFDDAGPDGDFDGVPNACDVCPGGDDTRDVDGDAVPDACDLCTGDDATGDADGDGVCADLDCDDGNPAVTCFIFADGFEAGDTSSWSAALP